MEVKAEIYELPLKEKFHIAHGSYSHRLSLIITVEKDDLKGYGEMVEISYYPYTVEDSYNELQGLIPHLNFEALQKDYDSIKGLTENIFLRSALDCATMDLYAKRENKSLKSLFNYTSSGAIPHSSFTLSIGNENPMELPDTLIKIKSGKTPPFELIDLICNDYNRRISVDANGSWDPEEIPRHLKELPLHKIEYIEQPCSPDISSEEIRNAFKDKNLLLYADESFQSLEDLPQCLQWADGVNIKMLKAGGIRPAYEQVQQTRKSGGLVMLGCMTESSIGISSAAQLAHLADHVDLDGAQLLAEDPASGVTFNNGKLSFPTRNGHTAELK